MRRTRGEGEERQMSESITKPTSRVAVLAALSHFKFAAYIEQQAPGTEDENADEYYASRLANFLRENIERSLPVLQPGSDTLTGWDRLTVEEREYSRKHSYLEHQSPFLPLMRNEGWGMRRIHRELVAILRAVIAIDPENLARYDVVIPGEEVSLIEEGTKDAADLGASELARLQNSGTQGHMLRYGLYIGLAMALEGKTSHEDLGSLARRLADELGANDPLERPDYQMGEEHKAFLKQLRDEAGK